MGEDVTVPIDRLPTLIRQIKEIGGKYDVIIPLIGHAGDGNVHPCILTDKKNTEQYAKARQAASDIFDAALSLGGVISGEHGIGLEKKEFLSRAM